MEPITFIVVTESGARIPVTGNSIDVHDKSEGKVVVTRKALIHPSLLCELVKVGDKWELVVGIEQPKCE